METKYPRQIVLEDKRLKQWLQEKTDMVIAGREVSVEVENIEKELEAIDKEIQEIEKTVDLKDLESKAKVITDEFNAVMKKMEGVKKEIVERCQQKVPKKLIEEYESTKKIKEQRENARNKIALKIQKWKDRIIPLTQKLAKPYLLEEFEDYNDVRIENGEVILEIFSHLEDYKARKRQQVATK